MEKTNTSKIAIIGYGHIAEVAAADLVRNNRPVVIAGRDFSKTKTLAEKLGSLAKPMEIGAAIREADVIILAIWFDAIQPFFYQYEAILQGKIIVDPSNPIAPDGKGSFVKTIGPNESAGQRNAASLPKNAKLVKALGTLSAGALASASNRKPDQAVLFYATDEKSIDAVVEELIRDMGFAPLRIGGLDQSIRLEVFGDLHEFGALGKTVSLQQAREITNIISV
ncbi:MAG TPA: NAD(P)-binding domain-containing protein [Puia sp.]